MATQKTQLQCVDSTSGDSTPTLSTLFKAAELNLLAALAIEEHATRNGHAVRSRDTDGSAELMLPLGILLKGARRDFEALSQTLPASTKLDDEIAYDAVHDLWQEANHSLLAARAIPQFADQHSGDISDVEDECISLMFAIRVLLDHSSHALDVLEAALWHAKRESLNRGGDAQ